MIIYSESGNYDYVQDWYRIDGIWEITPDPLAAADQYNRLPELNGMIIRTRTTKPGVMNNVYPVWISFCKIVPAGGGLLSLLGNRKFVEPGSETDEMKGAADLTNTGINIMIRLDNTTIIDSSRMYNFEFLTLTRQKIFGYIAGPTFDSIVILNRIE